MTPQLKAAIATIEPLSSPDRQQLLHQHREYYRNPQYRILEIVLRKNAMVKFAGSVLTIKRPTKLQRNKLSRVWKPRSSRLQSNKNSPTPNSLPFETEDGTDRYYPAKLQEAG